MKILLLAFALLFPLPPLAGDAPVPGEAGARVELHFFWSLTCPHCAAAHPYVEDLPRTRPWLDLRALEVSRDAENLRRFRDMVERSGTADQAGVPAFFFCGESYYGWDNDETTGALLRSRLEACRARILAGRSSAAASSVDAARSDFVLPGGIEAGNLSLPVLTLVLAGLDAFNPCAFFVLLFLLSMMVHQRSRARMLTIGGVFVLVSAAMYFAFMAAWLNVFQLFGHLGWITRVAGGLAVLVGVLNVKDFVYFGRGPSLSLSAARKTDIFRRARAILVADNLPTMLAATGFLAVAANFYELLCTAGFPMVYTRLLTLADLPVLERYAYLALYNLIYVLPLAAIVAVCVRSLGARRLDEREGRLLKLLAGLMMLELGLLLLIAPARAADGTTGLLLMLVAVLATAAAGLALRRRS